MGRWQSEYYDEVLGSKLKSLVNGAIERSKLEKDDPQAAPSISYENFVQDLDHGDSFTTTLVDILVKEYAERKTRPSATDRHLIAERTAKSLRGLSHMRAFRDRSTSRRPYVNDFFVSHTDGAGTTTLDWDVLTQHADDDDIDVDDDINTGAHRYNNDGPLYHSLADSNSTSTSIRRSFPVQTTDPATDDDLPPIPLGYPSRRSPPAHFSLARHSSLSRPPSLRRPARSRTNDFSEFTSRRRTNGRPDQVTQPAAGPSPRTSTSGAGDSSSSMDIANLLHSQPGEENEGVMPVATFAPGSTAFRRSITRVRSADERDGDSIRFNSGPLTLHSNRSPTGPAPSSSRLHINAPRLRRGGVRAPEQFATAASPAVGDGYTHTVRISSPPIPGLHTLSHREDEQRLPLPRRSSSAEMEYIIQTASARFGSRSPRGASPLSWGAGWGGSSGSNENVNGGQQQGDAPPNLPTPRSISPEDSPARETRE